MKKKSKLLAGLLIMVMSIMMIGGCGAKKEESKPVEGEV